ncbi:MAG: hypothetical protein HC835_07815 [Oscillatoriales cyanobacterium RM2_1_1]|nr:hypothetical protein [Oscillatoriales cyanobacterium SM2_3_0]NJO45538.1 hypothetical protein [Oscillatoriales cyanobacterium RM2_1_1]
MTLFHPEESTLIHFLKTYQPTPPSASSDLEERIMTAIDDSETVLAELNQSHRTSKHYLRSLRIAIALTAGLLTAWIGYGVYRPNQLSLREQQQLEDFIVSNWDEVMTGMSETEWLEVQESWAE